VLKEVCARRVRVAVVVAWRRGGRRRRRRHVVLHGAKWTSMHEASGHERGGRERGHVGEDKGGFWGHPGGGEGLGKGGTAAVDLITESRERGADVSIGRDGRAAGADWGTARTNSGMVCIWKDGGGSCVTGENRTESRNTLT